MEQGQGLVQKVEETEEVRVRAGLVEEGLEEKLVVEEETVRNEKKGDWYARRKRNRPTGVGARDWKA
jgi:hypothetical protein